MKESTLREILCISAEEYMRILNYIAKKDMEIGGHLMDSPGLLFDIGLYSFYPLLFSEIFDLKSNLEDIILYSRYYSGWLFILDKIFDEIYESYKRTDMLIMSLSLSAADYYLYKILPYSSIKKYEIFRTLRQANDHNMKKEDSFFKYGYQYSEDEVNQYCIDKYALAKTVVHVCFLCDKNADKSMYEKIILSHDFFSIARQLLDEIEDYVEDYSIGKFNIYANEQIIFYGRIVEENDLKYKLLLKAFECLRKAIRCLEDLPEFGWKRFLILNQKSLEKKINDGEYNSCKSR